MTALRETVAKIDPEGRELLIEGAVEFGAVTLATFLLRRKIRKLGYSEKEVYVLSMLFTSLFWTRMHLNGVRRELRLRRLGKTKAKP